MLYSFPLSYYLLLSSFLFSVGLAMAIMKKNILLVLIGIELMLNASNLNLVAFSKNDPFIEGQMLALFSILIAVCETVVILAIAIKIYQLSGVIDFNKLTILKNEKK